MLENTNKAIALNSVILYVKMIVTTICALLATRFALQALGVSDFGLFSVVGGIISFVAIFNTIMTSVSNRFIAVAIGRGVIKDINEQFSICLIIHIIIAILSLLFAFPIGDWYISRFLNYDGDISKALQVYNITIVGSVLSFVGIPFIGLLMAKERFWVFSVSDILSHIVRLVISYLLLYHFQNKLIIYAITVAATTILPTIISSAYCKLYFKDLIHFVFVKHFSKYKDVFSFSIWVSIGAVATIIKSQGAALIINGFFNTVMNTALGLANTVNSYIVQFSQNATQPMQPQITKSYAANNEERSTELLVMSTKFSFLAMFCISAPFLTGCDWILEKWLGSVPPYTTLFVYLLIVDNLIYSLNAGISNIIYASGNIKLFQIVISLFYILSVVAGYIALRMGAPAYGLIVAYIFVSIVKFFVIQAVLKKTIGFDNSILYRKSYFPSILIVALFLPVYFVKDLLPSLLFIVLSELYLLIIIYLIGLKQNERNKIMGACIRLLSKLNR